MFTRPDLPQHKQPLCAHTKPLCGLLDLKKLLEKTFQGPCLSGAPPPQYKQPLCGHSQPLCWLSDLKTLLENIFQGPKFIRGSPSTTPTTTVWAQSTIVLVN